MGRTLGEEEESKQGLLVGVQETAAGIVLPMLELAGEGTLTHSERLLSEVPRRTGDAEDHHEEIAEHSEVSAYHQ